MGLCSFERGEVVCRLGGCNREIELHPFLPFLALIASGIKLEPLGAPQRLQRRHLANTIVTQEHLDATVIQGWIGAQEGFCVADLTSTSRRSSLGQPFKSRQRSPRWA